MPCAGNNRGFTLLEVMVALMILATVLLAIYKLHSQTLSVTEATQFQSIAPLLAQKKIAALPAVLDGAGLGEETGDFDPQHPAYRWRTTVTIMASEALDGTEEQLARIDVEISTAATDKNFTLSTYRLLQSQ
jgi:general secretion pathway protein I